MQQFGPLHHVSSNTTVVDPRFGVGATPVLPDDWGGSNDGDNGGGSDGNGFVTRTSTHYRKQLVAGGQPSTADGVYEMYDTIDGGTYFTSRVLGQDVAGNDIKEYRYVQPNLSNTFSLQKLRVGLSAGLHGQETNPVIGLYHFMKDLIENTAGNETFNKLLSSCDFRIIPVASPSGWALGTRQTANGVNLDQNFSTYWTPTYEFAGSGPASEPETQIIEAWMEDNNLDVFIDNHNTVGIDDPWFAANHDTPEGLALIRDYYKVHTLNHMWWREREDVEYTATGVLGRLEQYPHQIPNSTVQAESLGVRHVAMPEIAARYSPDSYSGGPVSNTFSAETIGNLLIVSLTRILAEHNRMEP